MNSPEPLQRANAGVLFGNGRRQGLVWIFAPAILRRSLPSFVLDYGGQYRWGWRKEAKVLEMTVSGVYREIVTPTLIVCTEKFDDPWYPGEALDTYTFEEKAGKKISKITMRFETKESRDGVLASPMDRGVEESYVVLDALLASMA